MPESALTSALNATIITGNGNEGLLLNDMGNTLIKDSITGNIMSLSNGFIPLGMKERGGVLYIASYNPSTNKGELGTIPSPIIHYDYTKIEEKSITRKITDISESEDPEVKISERVDTSLVYILSDHFFHAGDKFIVILNLNLDPILSETKKYYYSNNIFTSNSFPQISYPNKRGWFKAKLIAVSSNGEEVEIDTSENQKYWTTDSQETSNYWFINSKDLENKQFNLNKTRTSGLFKTFPNIQSGRLAIKFEEELPDKLDWLYNDPSGKNLPLICYILNEQKKAIYYAICHGLQYKNGLCPVTPDKIEISCENFELYTTNYTNNGIPSLTNKGHKLIFYPFTSLNIDRRTITSPDYNLSDFPNYVISGEDYGDDGETVAKYPNAYFSLINGTTYDFLISKRLLSNLSFSNYDNKHSDGLFAIKIDDFKKKAIVHVKLYTKNFSYNNISRIGIDLRKSGDYILYDEYDLPEFDPRKSLGKFELTADEVKEQFLDFDLPDDYQFDIELFKKAEGNPEYNSCFLYDSEDPELHILQYEYDTDSNGNLRKYGRYIHRSMTRPGSPWPDDVWISHNLANYKNMRTYIYPIVVNKTVDDNSTSITPDISNSGFLWQGLMSNDYPDYKMSLSSTVNYLPVIKSSTQPLFCVNWQDRKEALFPSKWRNTDSNNDTGIPKMYREAKAMQEKAISFSNLCGYTTSDLKKYCIFNNNLECLRKEIAWINGSTDYAFRTPYGSGENKGKSGRENFFNAYSWENIGNNDTSLNGYDPWYLPTNKSKDYYKRQTIRLTNKQKIYGYTDIAGYPKGYNFNDSNKVLGYRGYAIGDVRYEYKNYVLYILFLRARVKNPFLTFIVGATPGFIRVDSEKTIINLPIIDYQYSLNYLYKNPLKIKFENILNTNLPSAVTLNYLQVPYKNEELIELRSGNAELAAYLANGRASLNKNFNYSIYMKSSSKSSHVDIKNIYNDYTPVDLKESKNIFTTYNDVKVLGIYNNDIDITIPTQYNSIDLSTHVLIKSHINYLEDTQITDVKIKEHEDDNKINRAIINQHILTSVQSNLFVNKSRSNLEYKKESDYKIVTLLKHPGFWMNNDSTLVAIDSNVEPIDLLSELSFAAYQENRTNPNKFLKNSFCNEKDIYLSIQETPEVIERSVTDVLEEGLYVFNFNTTENINITLELNGESKTLNKGQHVIAVWIPSGISLSKVKTIFKLQERDFTNSVTVVARSRAVDRTSSVTTLTKYTNTIEYIRNFGLFKVNTSNYSSNPASQVLIDLIGSKKINQNTSITWIEDNDILRNIVFPITFCYKEVDENGKNLGCLNETYQGFQTLPNRSNERFGGAYGLKDNIYASLDINSIPQDLKTIFGDTFREVFNNPQINIRQ